MIELQRTVHADNELGTGLIRLPEWVVVHVPHNCLQIPQEVRGQFVLSDAALQQELALMTDHHTLSLFASEVPSGQLACSQVSRLVVDVERFELDADEPMSARGMGAIYQCTHALRPLRRPLSEVEREELLSRWYRPHHQWLSDCVDHALLRFDRALVIDAHSYPSSPLPYEVDEGAHRPEICIGADEYHTPGSLVDDLVSRLEAAGLECAVNTPFAGALVPAKHYRRDPRVQAVMIEVRRDVYLDEATCTPLPGLAALASTLRRCLAESLMAVGQS